MSFGVSSLHSKLTKPTSFFSLKLWVVIVICISLFIVLILLIFALYFISWRRRKPSNVQFGLRKKNCHGTFNHSSRDRRLLSRNASEVESGTSQKEFVFSDRWSTQAGGKKNDVTDLESIGRCPLAALDVRGAGKQYTLGEIEVATDWLADESVIGSGDYGVVYRGVLMDNTRAAVKKLLYNSVKAEDFIVEAEAVRSVRHRNLVKLLGYCIEGAFRMLVYEYIDNGNLHQWLHGWRGEVSPLTWDIRMNIILGTAKGLAYLHEDFEPKIVHWHIKSSNILLDHQWNPKISDFGIIRLLGPAMGHVTTLMGMSGYMAPEYAATGVLNDKSDAYSFGILIMEIISGKAPIDYSGTEIEAVYLIDWLKSMVANQKFDSIVDPKLPKLPLLKELKRILLIALRCADIDANNRPKMGDVIHMLEPRNLLLSDECCFGQETTDCRS